jgi:ATP-dependent helicase/nuclease subunit A
MNEIDKSKIKEWWLECEKIITDNAFSPYFNSSQFDKFYNEVPIQFKDGEQTVYGIIDRLVIKDNHVTIIDYKTHPYVNNENIAEVAQHYKKQMQLYRKGVGLLWPDYETSTILLFTSIARDISI